MRKTKKLLSALPKNVQLTFITAAGITLVINTLYWISMLIRVYPSGMRLSQFSIMAIGQIIMPALLFAVSFYVYKKSTTRFDHIFNATILTVVGISIYHLVSSAEWQLSRYQDISSSLVNMTWAPLVSMVVAFCLFAALLLVISRRNNKVDHIKRLQIVTLAFVGLAFVVGTIFNLYALGSQYISRGDVINLLTHPQLVTPVILPLAFFIVAYLAIPKIHGRLARFYTAAIYALIGAMIIWITTTVFNLGAWALSANDFAALHALGLPTISATIISLAVYTFLIITHNRTSKAAKKTK
jgi:hypothetical protein